MPDWRSAQGGQWLAAAPARWAHPLWPVCLLVVTAVWSVAEAPVAACTTQAPCGADWWALSLAGAGLLNLYWIWRLPRLALLGLATTTVAGLLDSGLPAAFDGPADIAVLCAPAYAMVTIVHRLAAAGRQRLLAERAAGPVRHALPATAGRFGRGRLGFVLAALLLTVGVFAFWQAQQVIGEYEEHAAHGTRIAAEVTRIFEDDEGTTLIEAKSPEGGTHTVETAYPEDHPVGSTVDLVVDGEQVLMVAEPYDIFGWELLLLAAAASGLAFLANGVTGHLHTLRLRREPVPALKVLVREGHMDGRTWVYAADDLAGERPLLHFHSMYFDPDGEDEGDEDEDEDEALIASEWDESEEPEEEARAHEAAKAAAVLKGTDPVPPLCEAVLFGAPCTGAEVVFIAAEEDGEAAAEHSVTPVRPATAKLFGSPGSPGDRVRPQGRPADEVAAGMQPVVDPRTWSADGGSRALGLFLLLVQGGGIWAVADDGLSWRWLLLALGLLWLIGAVSTALNWRVTADHGGLWVAGPWRVEHVPWARITGVRHADDGIRISVSEGRDVSLSPTGAAWLERRLGRHPAAVRAAEEADALRRDPALRPVRDAEPGEQGMPLGPFVLALGVLWGAAVLLL